ncbi:MAG: BTAD domain-containing putative transcriptional regulator, partial [Ilumatobacteraceae bacterium]
MGADGDTFAIEVLGPIRVVDGTGRDSTPSGVLQRRLLALLALRRGSVVSADEAIEAAWPTDRPRDPAAALQTHLFRLRRVLPPGVVESVGDGYRLDASRVTLDADRLAAAVVAAEVDADAADVVESLLARWQGPAYPELVEVDAGRLAASSLEDLRVRAIEVGAGLELRAGRRAEAIARLAVLADEHPLRERPRSLLMAALAEEGRRVDALRVFDDFRRLLGDELGIDPSPALQEQHAALLGVGSPAATSSPERPHPPSVAASPLPIALTSLVGRDSLVDRVLGFVGACRLVTLVGPGGVGKTRLLLEVGTRLVAGNPDRPVVWCELATAAPDDVTGVVASVMQIDAQQGTSLEDRLATVLAGSEVVVLLDNCEHVLDDVARLVEHLLARCPRLHVVCTTRERLRVPGEQLCVVPTLPIDDEHDPAAQLFVERARAVAPDFEPDAAARSCIGEVVRRLDGLPLAIELAAARLHTMDVFSIAAALDRRFVLLAAGRRTSARHGSLRAALAWSVEMLDRRARDVFSELAVFNGAFSVGDVMAVSQLDRDTASIVIDLLAERS